MKAKELLQGRSWKTSGAGLAAIFTSLGGILTALCDNDPKTVPEWSLSGPLILAGIGLLFSRDNDKSSEDVGAAKPAAAAPPTVPGQ